MSSTLAEDDPSPKRLRLVAPIRPSASGSAAFLGLASDGRQYWIKAPNNPQGPRTLVAEFVAYGVGALIEAPVCANALMEIPSALDWSFAQGHRLHGGIGHASLNVEDVVVSDTWGTYSRLDNNRNRQALIVAMWDLCMGVDPQWLHQVTNDYSIWSFDHGFWLAGEVDWSIESLRRIGTNPWLYDLDIGIASAAGLRAAAERVEGLSLTSIQSVTSAVPLEWETTQQELWELGNILFVRAEGVAKRLGQAANQSRYP